MIIGDLGCAAGPNTLLFISSVISTIVELCKSSGDDYVELQFFLNDLPGNDFNELFRLIEKFKRPNITGERAHLQPLYYIHGSPESYTTGFFPVKVSTYSTLHTVFIGAPRKGFATEPEGLEAWRKTYLNEDNIYITKTTTPFVVKQFQNQFHKDFSLFLKLRHEELVHGGQMALIFLGRKNEDVYNGDLNQLFALVARALQSLVLKGLVDKEKLESFNLPVYGPSVGEVKELVMQSHLFNMDLIKQFEMNWDPFDDSEGDDVEDTARSSMNIAKLIRSVLKPLIVPHFGETIIDTWFTELRSLVVEHLEMEKTKFTTIIMSLKKE
ncbi:unnamed protein product [Miscanthus lutarioriparius]|uniref:Uncharacterized protein n=1 Tax=Miscanthus lutarioriparius TaxID=422564 RepID=A0A811PZG4_9POAL|nr:unnamed protein product [Miscanthus lutarioriparius]